MHATDWCLGVHDGVCKHSRVHSQKGLGCSPSPAQTLSRSCSRWVHCCKVLFNSSAKHLCYLLISTRHAIPCLNMVCICRVVLPLLHMMICRWLQCDATTSMQFLRAVPVA